ncbi:MAG: hypothetical protein IPL43_08205 [Micropruina sp.]|nr:hypothetical protein [Micropruina sp.]
MAYAAVSLSCTLPVFVAAVLGSLGDPRSTPWTAGVAVLAYALGMGAVLTTLALVVGLAGNVIAPKLLSISHQINRVSGAFVLLAGLYVIWYGWVEFRVAQGEQVSGGLVEWAGITSGQVGAALAGIGPVPVLVVAVAAFTLAGVSGVILARRRR